MPRDNDETIRLFYEADPAGEDALRYLDPAVELYPGIRAPDQGTRYAGHDGWKEFMADAIGLWEEVEIEPRERLAAPGTASLRSTNGSFAGGTGLRSSGSCRPSSPFATAS
jgi:hypothetical protein